MGARDDKSLALRRALAVALLLGVASVGVGSAPGALRRPNPSTAFFVGQTLTTVLLVMTSVLGAAVVWVAAQGTRRRRPRDDEPPPVPVRAGLSPTPLLLVVGLMALVGTWLLRWLPTASSSSTPAPQRPFAPAPTPTWTNRGHLPSVVPPGTSGAWPVWVVALLLVAAGAFAVVAARRPTGRPVPQSALEGSPAGDGSPAARTPAPAPPPPVTTSPAGSQREAVITAYEAASDALRRRSLARQPAETPDEYAERLGREVPAIGRAAEDLTTGYQRARFSDGATEPADARAAWSAARRVLDNLEARS